MLLAVSKMIAGTLAHSYAIVRVHSFNVDFAAKELSFYVVQDFAGTEQERELRELQSVMSSCFPDMKIEINTALNA